jgi:GT2 family glycosyltransferase
LSIDFLVPFGYYNSGLSAQQKRKEKLNMALLGKLVTIIDLDSEWFAIQGVIRGYDGDSYLIRFRSGQKVIFSRKQFAIPGMEG